MEKEENATNLFKQTKDMLTVLESLIHAPKGSISFADSSALPPGTIYHRPAIDSGGKNFSFILTGVPFQDHLLLCRTIDVLAETYQNFRYSLKGGSWFYDYTKKKNYSSESLAKTVYRELYNRLYEFYDGALGIDFDIMTALAEAAYEKDAAVGSLLFYTGHLSSPQLEQWCQPLFRDPVTLCEKNIRHVRKLLAGTGNDKGDNTGSSGLLFVRNTNGDQYFCYGYIGREFFREAFASVYIDGKGGWMLNIGNQASFCVKDNRAFLPPSLLEGVREKLESELGKEYGGLFPVLKALSAQGHGTSVVFLDLGTEGSFAGERMRTLANRGRAVEVHPISLKAAEKDQKLQAMLKNISNVDGAIVVDYPRWEIHYTNVIVDGNAVISGKPDAGARHNALRAFVADLAKEGDPEHCPAALACIFSEDGGVSVETASGCWEDMKKEDMETEDMETEKRARKKKR